MPWREGGLTGRRSWSRILTDDLGACTGILRARIGYGNFFELFVQKDARIAWAANRGVLTFAIREMKA
jgi:hypothetical protein